MQTGNLDRRVQFLRATLVDDGYQTVQVWNDHGVPVWAQKTDASDSERWRASEVSASISARFVVRWSSFTRDITPKDRLSCEGVEYGITAIKEKDGRHAWLEISATARADQ